MALSVGAPRHLGHGHSVCPDADKYHDQWAARKGFGTAHEAVDPLCVQPCEWGADLANRGKARAEREWYSPTQPIPTKPPAYGRSGFSLDDVIDFTPELKAQALQIISKYKIGPLFTPPVVSQPEGPLGTLEIGCCQGGTNWPGGSYDPQTHLLYVYGKSELGSLGLVPPAKGQSDMNYIQGRAVSPRRAAGAGTPVV